MEKWKVLAMIIWCLLSVLYIYIVISLWNDMRKNEQIMEEREEDVE